MPNLKLALFIGVAVSLGAVSGIAFAPRFPPPVLPPALILMPSPLTAMIWLAVFAIVGWLGWRIYMRQRSGAALVLWSVMFAGLVVWRAFIFGLGIVWLGAGILMGSAVLAAALWPLLLPIGAGTAWACLPLVLWMAYRSLGLVLMPVFG